jgi:hypothetical protein
VKRAEAEEPIDAVAAAALADFVRDLA